MKKSTTMKNIKNTYTHILQAPYCTLQDVLYNMDAQYYNSGAYGWNCDIYTFGDVAIVTGHHNMCGKKIPPETIDKYAAIARSIIVDDYHLDYADKMNALTVNVTKMINECIAA